MVETLVMLVEEETAGLVVETVSLPGDGAPPVCLGAMAANASFRSSSLVFGFSLSFLLPVFRCEMHFIFALGMVDVSRKQDKHKPIVSMIERQKTKI